jgi:hypothetical protein
MNRGWLWLLLIFACETQAFATGSLSGIIKTSSGYAFKTGTVSAGTVTGSAGVQVAGKTVSYPVTATLKSTAPSVLVAAARLTPTSLVVGLTASWLLDYGLSYTNGQWFKSSSLAPSYSVDGRASAGTQEAACLNRYSGGTVTRVANNRFQCWNSVHTFYYLGDATCATGPAAVWGGDGYATCAATVTNPAQEADFAVPSAQTTLPDGVATEAAPKIAEGLPLNPPTVPSTPTVVAIGDPYIDPVTGQTKQPYVKVTPSPTAEDPLRVDIQMFEKEVAPPDPAKAETGAIAPEAGEPKDPCLENPNRMGCLDAGDPSDEQLQTQNVPFSLTPVTVGDAGSCPATKTFTHAGSTYSFSYAPICNGATLIKPVVLAIAWLLAAYIVLGTLRET